MAQPKKPAKPGPDCPSCGAPTTLERTTEKMKRGGLEFPVKLQFYVCSKGCKRFASEEMHRKNNRAISTQWTIKRKDAMARRKMA